MVTELSALSLNCWGLPSNTPILYSEKKDTRIGLICEFIKEIWLKSDYERIKTSLRTVLPYSKYFNEGLIGSGTCIFSRFKLRTPKEFELNGTLRTFQSYKMNGYPHQVWYGDAMANAGLGQVEVQVGELTILLAVTHFHAEYDMFKKPFLLDRTLQALELKYELWNHGAKDLLIVAGDFNSAPASLPYSVLSSFLQDTVKPGEHEYTWSHPDNFFKEPTDAPETLDYIFYRTSHKTTVEAKGWYPLSSPGSGYHYLLSDHQPVMASFKLSACTEEGTARTTESAKKFPSRLRDEVLQLLQYGLDAHRREIRTVLTLILFCVAMLIYLANSECSFGMLTVGSLVAGLVWYTRFIYQRKTIIHGKIFNPFYFHPF